MLHIELESIDKRDLLHKLGTDADAGLSRKKVKARLKRQAGKIKRHGGNNLRLLLAQFNSPFMFMLLVADALSFYLGERIDAVIILSVIVVSGILSFYQEKGAKDIISKLLDMVRVKVTVIRSGSKSDILTEEVVPGDIILMDAGDVIPADCVLLESTDLFVNESMLTGEAFPVFKSTIQDENNKSVLLYKGTHVTSGFGKAVAVLTGEETKFGQLKERLVQVKNETEFERGLKKFTYLLMELAITLTFIIFAVNIYSGKPFVDSLLFSLSLSIGITPFLLPAIVSVNLAYGARHMAARKVIVKRLVAIENFGSMNVFCSDKTGTLTRGEMKLAKVVAAEEAEDPVILKYAFINADLQSGYTNPIDMAIKAARPEGLMAYKKIDEKPYDFVRKCLSIIADHDGKVIQITKGAFSKIIEKCSTVSVNNSVEPVDAFISEIQKQYENYSEEGYRIIAVACKNINGSEGGINEENMTWLGMLLFSDPLKDGVKEAIERMNALGVKLKVLTGDNQKVTAHVGKLLGLNYRQVLTGAEVDNLPDDALKYRIPAVDLFAELEPVQKERLVRLISHSGNVVGYIGDGINDVSAMHAADVGISVSNAVDVARSTADIILLEKDLNVLIDGILEGRKTFINTIKYIFMTSSANFGNIISMSVMSVFLPFLPLLPKQLLATNLITDIPAMTIPSDKTEESWITKPKKWDVSFIKKFMVSFGLLSSVFDFITLGLLYYVLKSSAAEFRSGWFTITIFTEFAVLWILRGKGVFFRSLPGKYLAASTLLMFAATVVLPYTGIGVLLDLHPLPIRHFIFILLIVGGYILMNEILKRIFYRKNDL